MEGLRLDDLKVLGPIGSGGSGHVYEAVDASGGQMALKIFEGSSISSGLLQRTIEQLRAGAWPDGLMPVAMAEFRGTPPFLLMPLVADRAGGADDRSGKSLIPRSLQYRLDQHPGLDSWNLVKSIAKALSGMHSRRVVHGNLKPGNIFFDEKGAVLLTDWAMGNMPRIAQFQFTDAVLYQAPEQLREPGVYLTGAGYRLDVFAFGVLAYRLLTGRFPRCHPAFSQVAPRSGETQRDGFSADLHKIAGNLESQVEVDWPTAPNSSLEKGWRECINACLALDPDSRPSSMIDLVHALEEVEQKIRDQKSVDAVIKPPVIVDKSTSRIHFGLGVAIGFVLVFAFLWFATRHQVDLDRQERLLNSTMLGKVLDEAKTAKGLAESRARETEQAMANEREAGLARLEASRWVGDLLFSWALEKDHRGVPPLDGNEARLKRLERYFEEFLSRTEKVESLQEERAMVRLQLAEISLAAGDPVAATRRLDEASKVWGARAMTGDTSLRFATNSLLLAMLLQSQHDPGAKAAFESARRAVSSVPRADVDGVRLDQLSAILDFHESKLVADAGDETKALEQLMRSTQTLVRISKQRPDSAALKSQLADGYKSAAALLEAAGNLADAREVRAMAAARLTEWVKERPRDLRARLDLAGCYGAMSEDALLSGNLTEAESHSAEAMRLLDGVLAEQADQAEAVAGKAVQLGIRASMLRDRGQSEEAMKDYDDGIRMLEALEAKGAGNSMSSYRLALLWWQKARMLGMAGLRDKEIEWMVKACQRLETLQAKPTADGPAGEPLSRSKAYLLGDLGHALQVSERKDEAIRTFTDALSQWQSLAAKRPRNDEYAEGLLWCRQRLDDLK